MLEGGRNVSTTPHEIEVYVRFCETDAIGHVNNTSYFLYFEEARTKFFSILHPERKRSLGFILASIKCDYINQAYAEQILKVYTYVTKIGNKSFTMEQIIKSEADGKIIAQAIVTTVCFNHKEQKSITIPEVLRQNLQQKLLV